MSDTDIERRKEEERKKLAKWGEEYKARHQLEEIETDEEIVEKFRLFLENFKNVSNKPIYLKQIKSLVNSKNEDDPHIAFDFLHSTRYDFESNAINFYKYPDRSLSLFKLAVMSFIEEEDGLYADRIRDKLQIRLENFHEYNKNRNRSSSIKHLNTKTIEKLVSFACQVVNVSDVFNVGFKLIYRCKDYRCNSANEVNYNFSEDMKLPKPQSCYNCGEKKIKLDLQNSIFKNIQFLVVQDLQQNLGANSNPSQVSCILTDGLINKVGVGEKIIITGIHRIEELANFKNYKNAIFNKKIEVNNIAPYDDNPSNLSALSQAYNLTITKEDRDRFKKMVSSDNFYQRLLNSFAPNIFGYNEIKEGLLHAVVSNNHYLSDQEYKVKQATKRDIIHCLLVGDASTSKTQFLLYLKDLLPNLYYTNGQGASGVGLTAAAIKDTDTGHFNAVAGPIVLADRSICLIDEFDKMGDEDRKALHETMEQLTTTITKAGIHISMNARTTIIAAANPKHGRYNEYKSVIDNINLPIPLITRFGLIYITKDKQDRDKDNKIARKMLGLEIEGEDSTLLIPPLELRKYLMYARSITVDLSQEAREMLTKYYVDLREKVNKQDSDSKNDYHISARQLDDLKRIAKSHAKLLLKEVADKSDVEEAIRIQKEMLRSVAIDLETGMVDVQIINAGISKSVGNKQEVFQETFRGLSKDHTEMVEIDHFIEQLVRTEKFNHSNAAEAIKKAVRTGYLHEPKPGYLEKA